MAASALTSSLVVRLIDQVTAPARAASKSLLGLNRAAGGDFGSRLNDAMARTNAALDRSRGALADAAIGLFAFKSALQAPIKSAMDFESAMADIAKVSGFDDAGLAAYAKQLRNLANKEIPMAVTDLAALSAAAAQAGVPDEDLFDFTRLTAKAAVAWEVTGAQAGEALAKIRTALNLTNAQTAAYADAINYVSDSLATNAPELIDFTKRVAVQGEFFGFAKEQSVAFGAAMISAGFNADVAATSFRNMGRALTKGASATKAQRGAYETLGLDAKKVAKAMQKDAVGTTMKVIEKLGQLPEHMQAAVMSGLFGDEAAALVPLLKNTELLRKALSLTADEQKYLNSVGKEFEKRAATSAYKLQRFKSQIADIGLTIGGALLPAITQITEALGPTLLKFSEWSEAHPALIRNVIAATTAVVGFKVAVAGLRFIGLMGRGGALSMMALGFNTVGRAAIGATRAAKAAVGLQVALGAMSGAKLTGFQTMATALRGVVFAVPGVSALGGALSAVGAALSAITLPIAAGIAAVAASGFLIYKYWDRAASFVTGVGKAYGEVLAPAIERVKPALQWLKPIGAAIATGWEKAGQAISSFSEWIGSFFQREVLNERQKAQWETAGYDAATRMINAIKNVFSGIVDWASGIGSRIGAAIANGAVSGLNRIKGWVGLGGEEAPAPGNDNSEPSSGVSGHRKNGGNMWPGGSFLVGEDEPEVVSPKTGSTIIPLSKLGGQTSISFGDIIIQGGNSHREAVHAVREVLRDEIREALRSAHADTGAR
ncbi:Phage-related minor tail protein [compost metagenome]